MVMVKAEEAKMEGILEVKRTKILKDNLQRMVKNMKRPLMARNLIGVASVGDGLIIEQKSIDRKRKIMRRLMKNQRITKNKPMLL